MIKTNTKSGRIYVFLKDSIEKGAYAAGEQLPSCRQLSKKFNVSYVTANRAVKQLVQQGIVRNYRGKGVYVPSFEITSRSIRKVKIFGSMSVAPSMVQYINEVPIFLKKNGWNVSSFFLNETLEDIRTELKDEDSFFVFYGILGLQTHHFFELITAFGISKRTILLGELGNQFGISSIIADEPLQIRTAMNLLQKAGCEKVGLFEGNIANSVEQQRFATWRNYYPNNEWRDYLFDANLSGSDALAIEKASFFLKKAYQLGRFNKISAMIFPDPRIAGMSVGLFKDLKIKVPETLSIVAIGDANFLTFVRPQITVVDPNMNEHIQTILKILEDKFNGKNELPLLHLCEPKTIERDSIRVPKQG